MDKEVLEGLLATLQEEADRLFAKADDNRHQSDFDSGAIYAINFAIGATRFCLKYEVGA